MIGFFLRIEHEDSGMQMGINNKSVTARQILRNFFREAGQQSQANDRVSKMLFLTSSVHFKVTWWKKSSVPELNT